MNRKVLSFIAIGVVVAIVIGFLLFQENQLTGSENRIFHVTLADPAIYENGVFTGSFEIKKGNYQFRFVPNGDSPQSLTITMEGESIHYVENFTLEGTAHETGISTYYTWEYLGNYLIRIPEDQLVKISIDPHGNLLGPVSVDILK